MADLKSLEEFLIYDPETGIFTWKVRPTIRMKHAKVGARAGAIGSSGYRYIKYQRKLYREHALAYAFMGINVPKGMEIDHIDGDRQNNKISNLRLATHQQNLANCKNRKNNTSGCKGVTRHVDGRWRSKIMVSGRTFHLGLFKSVDEASQAYERAAKKHFGEFARAK